jgi:hypothetical protein
LKKLIKEKKSSIKIESVAEIHGADEFGHDFCVSLQEQDVQKDEVILNKKHTCQICNKEYVQIGGLRAHMRATRVKGRFCAVIVVKVLLDRASYSDTFASTQTSVLLFAKYHERIQTKIPSF